MDVDEVVDGVLTLLKKPTRCRLWKLFEEIQELSFASRNLCEDLPDLKRNAPVLGFLEIQVIILLEYVE